MKTYIAKTGEIERKWYLIDAEGQTLGRLTSRIASILRGKTKTTFTPSVDMGDFVIVINAEKVHVTGNKSQQKMYRHHTGYPGGFRETSFDKLIQKHPERIIEKAVRGMLPHTRLGDDQYTKLKVYKGTEHPHQAQQPIEIKL